MRILFAEMDTYENELKFQINKQQGFHRILQYLDSEYLLLPYKKSLVTDYYYDYNSILLELGASYRIRYRPNISLNLKIPHHNTGFIISRQEFTMKAETKDVKARLIQMKDCVINQLTKRILGLENLALMEPMA
ncbi:MAG: hypothetical protein Q8S19_03090, partial [Bacillota bacterium]|nr:hypothetical protein [Bacillota bacterium]